MIDEATTQKEIWYWDRLRFIYKTAGKDPETAVYRYLVVRCGVDDEQARIIATSPRLKAGQQQSGGGK